MGSGNKEDIKRFTTGYSGLKNSYEVFRIDTGTLLATQESIGCRVQLKLSFTALQRNASTGDQWYALESNNSLEQTLLDMCHRASAHQSIRRANDRGLKPELILVVD